MDFHNLMTPLFVFVLFVLAHFGWDVGGLIVPAIRRLIEDLKGR